MADEITLDEWLTALQGFAAESPEGFSTTDVMVRMKLSRRTIGQKMREWHRSGLIEHAGFRWESGMDGRPCRIPVYRLVKKG